MKNKICILNGGKYFSSGIFQNHLVFIPVNKYVKCFSGTTRTDSLKFNEMSEENSKLLLSQTAILHQLLLIIIYNHTYILMDIKIILLSLKSNKSIYFLQTKSTIKKLKHILRNKQTIA